MKLPENTIPAGLSVGVVCFREKLPVAGLKEGVAEIGRPCHFAVKHDYVDVQRHLVKPSPLASSPEFDFSLLAQLLEVR